MSERPEIYYKIAVDRLREDESEDRKKKRRRNQNGKVCLLKNATPSLPLA